MKNNKKQIIYIVLIITVLVVCGFFFLDKIKCYYTEGPQGGIGKYSNHEKQDAPLKNSAKRTLKITLQQNEFDGGHVRAVLNQLLDQQLHTPGHSLPISQESIDWISRLPFDHAVSMLHILSHTPSMDWQEQVVSLRNLAPHEQKRALKINRFTANNGDCIETECWGQ